MLATVLTVTLGVARESAAVLGVNAVLLVTFVPFGRLLADRVGYAPVDERTREITRTATSRADPSGRLSAVSPAEAAPVSGSGHRNVPLDAIAFV